MKKLLTLVTVVALLLLPTLASAKKAPPQVKGHITVWNEASKELIVKDSKGKEHIFGWDDKTKVMGMPKVGEQAKVMYKTDSGGKKWATEIHAGEHANAEAPPKKK